MKRSSPVIALALLTVAPFSPGRASAEESAAQLQAAFAKYSGARLVFDADDLPRGSYHDVMPSLDAGGRLRAARIALREVRKLPPGYLKKAGLQAVGIFAACVSRQGDGFRPYDEGLKGYRYYGIYNGENAIAAAYYTDGQLPLTFHHEIFHHIDATRRGVPGHTETFSRDARFKAAISGEDPYPALRLGADDLAALRKAGEGYVLERAVSRYAEKSVGEDKAETARFLMTALPDGLVQMATRPQLPGSQRMLHVLQRYRQAVADGPDVDWFVGVALGRAAAVEKPVREPVEPVGGAAGADALLGRLRALLAAGEDAVSPDEAVTEARTLLEQAAALSSADLPKEKASQLVTLAAELTHRLLRWRLRPETSDRVFTVWGAEDRSGVNWTLRGDVTALADDAKRLKKIAALAPDTADLLLRTQLKDLRLVARYERFIDSRWSLSDGTKQVFDRARHDLALSLPEQQAALSQALLAADPSVLAESISAEGRAELRREVRRPRADNPYIKKVDAAIDDPEVRAAIRRVQPACVRLGGGSGVNLTPDGHILTAGHVPERLGARLTVVFPDGRKYPGVCTAYDRRLDLAVVKVTTTDELPYAPLSKEPPERGTRVVVIGQPGSWTPGGDATGYQPFHVSAGSIRGFVGDPLGEQSLGRTKHDAWTYWGHSGSPLFDEHGRVVALHNSWDSTTAMRHAVTHQAIVHFLTREKVPFTTGQ